jgi:Domain of unknown function (DUF222)
MTTQTAPRHRVSAATAQMRACADTVVDASVWSMDTAETAATLVELTRLDAQVAELRARVAAHADDLRVGDDVGATSTANWLAHQIRLTRPAAHRAVRFGHDLEHHPLVRDALAAGAVLAEQARVIITAVEHLPAGLDSTLTAKAETYLLDAAREHDAKALTILGRRLLEVIAPEIADAHEADQLEKEERDAARACRLTMSDDGHGKVHGRFTLPTLHGAMLKKYLLVLAAPKHLAATHGPGLARRPGPERLGRAFCELLERFPAQGLPQAGGVNATVVVLLSYETLIGNLEQAGVLDTGERISPATARRLACQAGIIPAVLGGPSEVLDLGRKTRYYTTAQRIAMTIRDRTCTTQGCDWPPGLCHAHHLQQWSQGGPTDLDKGRLLCPKHHTRAHDPAYETTHHADGKLSFHRRQ